VTRPAQDDLDREILDILPDEFFDVDTYMALKPAVRARVRALIELRIAEAEARGAKKAYDDVIEWCKTYRGGGERGDAYDDAYLDGVEECGRYAERRAREEKP
jgi:hypothetical protein